MATDGPAKRAPIPTDGAIEAFVDLVIDFLERRKIATARVSPKRRTKLRSRGGAKR
jgi:hypothetical protein